MEVAVKVKVMAKEEWWVTSRMEGERKKGEDDGEGWKEGRMMDDGSIERKMKDGRKEG
jgi:hypothetical protein